MTTDNQSNTATTDGWREIDWGASTALRKEIAEGVTATITQCPDGAARDGVFTDLAIQGATSEVHRLPREFQGDDGVEQAIRHADKVAREIGAAK